MTTLYLAGPMTGKPRWNFDAFEEARDALRAKGYTVLCPAEAELAEGFDPDAPTGEFTNAMLRAALRRDADMVLRSDGVALLPGWMDSRGAFAEYALASAASIRTAGVRTWLGEAGAGE